jgi:hypothetical protein
VRRVAGYPAEVKKLRGIAALDRDAFRGKSRLEVVGQMLKEFEV